MIRIPHGREYLPMRCRSCDAERVRLVIDLGDQPNANKLVRPGQSDPPFYPLRFGYCELCTLMQIDATIPRDDMFGDDYVYVSGTTVTLQRHFQATTQRLRSLYSIKPDDLVVDIGSNDGTWLRTWGDGQNKLGIEPASIIAREATQSGVPTLARFFDLDTARMVKGTLGPAKLITSAGSFFHMEDLHGACDGVRELLADDGVFVCQAISGNQMIADAAFDQILHEHLCYYTPTSFDKLVWRHELAISDVHISPIHGGTWEYHVTRRRANSRPHPGISFKFEYLSSFAARVDGCYHVLIRMLKSYAAAGKKVWAYGAPGKGGTLLNSFGIGPDLVQCATEKNPRKFGLEIPGCRIPIVPESDEKPDAFLVLAWNFLPEFREKERDWLAAGGEFIVPVPNVRIVRG